MEKAPIPKPLREYMRGLATHDLALIDTSLDPNVRFVTPVRIMDRDAILDFLAALYRGFPDWHYDHDPPEVCPSTDGDGDARCRVMWRQGGTHTGELAFSGFDSVAPTGKRVVIQEHFFYYKVGDRGLTEIKPDPIPGGAPRGIFEQIGVAVPPL